MMSFEWLEFETLSREVTELEEQFDEAKATKNHGRWQILEPQLEGAKRRREKALEAITRRAASTAIEQGPDPGKPSQPGRRMVVEDAPVILVPKPITEQYVTAKTEEALTVLSRSSPSKEADTMWEQLTPSLLNKAQQQLNRRRQEMIARHAEELQSLEADEEQIDAFVQAIEAFFSKFTPTAPEADVIQLTQ
jgi:hypothetical protein